jgi:RNA polymerase sigma factor (sigma-70 family)
MEQAPHQSVISNDTIGIVEDNILFARRLAHRFYSRRSHSQAEIDDIVSSAYLGLCEAGSRYELHKNDAFRSYSYFRIMGSMYEYLRTSGGLSRAEYNLMHGEDKKEAQKKEPLQFAGTVRQLSHLKTDVENCGMSINVNHEKNTVDLTYVNDEPQDYACHRKEVIRKLRAALEELSEDMKRILVARYFEGRTLTEILPDFPHMSKSSISRLHSKALLTLRAKLASSLESYHTF